MSFLSDLATASGWPTDVAPATTISTPEGPGKVPPASNLLDRVFPPDLCFTEPDTHVRLDQPYGWWTT